MAAGSILIATLPSCTVRLTELNDEPDWVVVSAAIAIIAALGSIATSFL